MYLQAGSCLKQKGGAFEIEKPYANPSWVSELGTFCVKDWRKQSKDRRLSKQAYRILSYQQQTYFKYLIGIFTTL